jgi:hypothetical protein
MAEGKKEDLEFERMPGSDPIEGAEPGFDFNFGLGEEQAEQSEPEVAEVEAVSEPEEEESEEEEVETTSEADEQPEEEPVAEVEEQPVAEVEEEPVKEQPMIPKSRFDEVLQKQKALQKRLDEIQAAQEKAEQKANLPEYDFESKEREYQNLVLDGEVDKAAAVRNEIRQAERDRLTAELKDEITQNVHQNQEAILLQQAANTLEAEYPVFDQNSLDYNEDYTQEAIKLRDAFIIQGDSAVDALNQASKFVIDKYGIGTPAPEAQNALTSKVAPKKVVDEVAMKRAEVSKKLKAAESQPPELPGDSSASHGEKPLDVSNLSEDEFNALPEATLKRLRGDIV